MSKSLVIVESPAKAKTISKILGNGFEVIPSMGHVVDLPRTRMGVDIEHNFAPSFIVAASKKKILSRIKSEAREADKIYLATDPDREGEAIAWNIREKLNRDDKKYLRVVFHELTKSAIDEAFENMGEINVNLVDAQQARRVLDRLVGYKLSPLLWKKVRFGWHIEAKFGIGLLMIMSMIMIPRLKGLRLGWQNLKLILTILSAHLLLMALKSIVQRQVMVIYPYRQEELRLTKMVMSG